MKTLLFLVLLLGSSPALAIDNFNPGDLSGVTDPMVNEMLKMASIGTAHRPVQPAGSLGMTLGLVIGVEVAAVSVTDEFKSALSQATQEPQSNLPSVLPIPRLSIHKGLPGKFDIGFSYLKYQDAVKVWGIHGAWNFLSGGTKPSLGVRIAYGKSRLYFIDTYNFGLDVVASKNLAIIEPYVGTGMQIWGGTLDVPSGGATGLPVGVSGSQSGATGHFFAGLPLKLLFIHLTGEIDYSLAGITTYGGKISLSF